MSTREIVVCGPTFLDVVMADMPDGPKLGAKLWASSSALTAGGAANQAVAIARLSRSVQLVTHLGEDRAGQIVRSVLSESGVGIDYASSIKSQPVCVSLGWDGERAVVAHGSYEGGVLPSNKTPALLVADLHAIGNNSEEVKNWRAKGTTVIGSIGWDTTGAWRTSDLEPLAYCDYFVLSEAEILHYARCFDVREAVSMIGQLVDTRARIVVTRGARGVAVGSDTYWTLPSLESGESDPMIASDAFIAGLAVAVASNATDREAVSFALTVAAVSRSRPGGKDCTPTMEQIRLEVEHLAIPQSFDLSVLSSL